MVWWSIVFFVIYILQLASTYLLLMMIVRSFTVIGQFVSLVNSDDECFIDSWVIASPCLVTERSEEIRVDMLALYWMVILDLIVDSACHRRILIKYPLTFPRFCHPWRKWVRRQCNRWKISEQLLKSKKYLVSRSFYLRNKHGEFILFTLKWQKR